MQGFTGFLVIQTSDSQDKMKDEKNQLFRVGELAAMAGVTVRTLQHYDQKNLLNSKYNQSHKRIYNQDDLLKLQQIMFLKSLGFSLKEIDKIITKQISDVDLERVFTTQRKVLLDRIQNLDELINILNVIISEISAGQKISMERILTILNLMNQENPYAFIIQYFDDEQLRAINNCLLQNPEIQRDEKELFLQLENLYHRGDDPAGIRGQELAKQWWELACAFTFGDREMMKTLFSIGKDSEKWPDNMKDVQKSIEDFLTKALHIYLHNNNILT